MPYKYRSNLYAAQKRHRLRVRAELFEFLSTQSCVDCGEKDPIVLEFDHRDSRDKFKNVRYVARIVTEERRTLNSHILEEASPDSLMDKTPDF
jgi:hypothetical protein